jgi:uncharacterized protein
MRERVYHDPLHGAIRLETADPAEALAIQLIDSEPFQRLRRIRQLGPAFLTFHGAESSRFTHSLGVLELARQALRQLERHHPELAAHRGVLYAAALLHDLGHAPLSHTGEEMFGLKHEAWSARLIREHPSLRGPLEAFGPGSAEAVAQLLQGTHTVCPAIQALVSSQLDCDRLDYLLRDSYSTGTSYGHLDLERILAALTLAPDGGLAIHPKGLMAVEHYLVVRNLMYRTVYNHRLNVVCNWLLRQAIRHGPQPWAPQRVWADAGDGPLALGAPGSEPGGLPGQRRHPHRLPPACAGWRSGPDELARSLPAAAGAAAAQGHRCESPGGQPGAAGTAGRGPAAWAEEEGFWKRR